MDGIQRVRYKKSPLVEVIFQLRFPTILSINSKEPADFQDKIREKYPLFQDGTEQQNEVFINPDFSSGSVKHTMNKNYAFLTAEGNYKINLTASFISISTVGYTQWEDFEKHIEHIIPIFEEVYKPAFYTRVGLRYVDVFTRSSWNLENKKWSDLIQSHILGMMADEFEDGTRAYSADAEYHSGDDQFATRKHVELVHVNNQPELSLLVDCDYFTLSGVQKTEMAEASKKLHELSTQFIRSTIKDDLHNAMEPCDINE